MDKPFINFLNNAPEKSASEDNEFMEKVKCLKERIDYWNSQYGLDFQVNFDLYHGKYNSLTEGNYRIKTGTLEELYAIMMAYVHAYTNGVYNAKNGNLRGEEYK